MVKLGPSVLFLVSTAGCVASAGRPLAGPAPALLDGFDDVAPWTALSSDGVQASIRPAAGVEQKALELAFDLGGVAGWAATRRTLPLDLTTNFELSFFVRGDAPPNNLEFKLIDATGENVWWYVLRDFEFSPEWRRVVIRRRHVEFAWGPLEDRTLRQTASVELVVAAGKGGGRGAVHFDRLEFRRLPEEPETWTPRSAEASSSAGESHGAAAIDGRLDTAWRTSAEKGSDELLTVDLGALREFGGLVLRWAPAARAVRYDVELSDHGESWRVVKKVARRRGEVDHVRLPEALARFVRLRLREGGGREYGLREIELRSVAFGRLNPFLHAVAEEAPRGRYPRGFRGEQSYWTVVGNSDGTGCALLSEDGALELGRGSASVEPFIRAGGELVSWADVEKQATLRDGYLPIPSVTWRHPNWVLEIEAYPAPPAARRSSGAPWYAVRYSIRNRTASEQALSLVLAVRPFQVNPPTQELNLLGGASRIESLAWDGTAVRINDRDVIRPRMAPDRIGMASFEGGGLAEALAVVGGRGPRELRDDEGLAEGVIVYDLTLPPEGKKTVELLVSHAPEEGAPAVEGVSVDRVAADWREQLNRVVIRVPREGQKRIDTLRTSLAYVLSMRDGPALRPGTRSYARSWIRDGAMMSSGLLRLGHAEAASAYLRWYAPHQFEDGKVPCCVDDRGADPVAEHDSHGELAFLAAEIFRYTGDRALAEEAWPRVERAARYIETQRQSERTAANEAPDRRHFYGLLPPSISHEGYSSKPAYAYWDDFWALRGLKDAATLARVLDRTETAKQLDEWVVSFRADLYRSIQAAAAFHRVSYIPGSADRGDFDATSTTVALAPGGEHANLPRALLTSTFERYWQAFVDRRDGTTPWTTYTPYELRAVGTFTRLGWRERANALLDFFLAHRRPAAWNQWAEVVGQDTRNPVFIGDMPHGWVASDYISAILDTFAYVREADQTLVIAAGVPAKWFEGPDGFSVQQLRTPYGRLTYSVQITARRVRIEIDGPARPPGGFILPSPWTRHTPPVRLDGRTVRWRDGTLFVPTSPARIEIDRP